MHVANAVYPTEQQLAGFLAPGAPSPIYMVNLLRFKSHADYPDGRQSDLSGRDAYMIYGNAVATLIREFGGAAVFSASVERLMLGEVEDLWDMVAIAMYPSRAAMMAMMRSPKMQEIGVHRAAGLAGQLNIETIRAQGEWLTRTG
jgi:uncharacterized protein (DUF1330 family)